MKSRESFSEKRFDLVRSTRYLLAAVILPQSFYQLKPHQFAI